jgi:hypothetical protein
MKCASRLSNDRSSLDSHRRVDVLSTARVAVGARRAISIVVATLLISSLIAMLLAQWLLRPIHVIQQS